MSYQLPPDIEKLVQVHIASGAYPSEDDVLRDALRALAEQQATHSEEDQAVVEGIRRGLADIRAVHHDRVVAEPARANGKALPHHGGPCTPCSSMATMRIKAA